LNLSLVFHEPARNVVLEQLRERLGFFAVGHLELIVLDLEICGVLLKGLKLGLNNFLLLSHCLELAGKLGVLALRLEEACLLLDKDSLELLVLVLDSYGGLLELSHLRESGLLHTLEVLSAAILDYAFLVFNNLLHCEVLVKLMLLLVHHRLHHLPFHSLAVLG